MILGWLLYILIIRSI